MRPLAVEHTAITMTREQMDVLLAVLGDCWATGDEEGITATYYWLRTGVEHT